MQTDRAFKESKDLNEAKERLAKALEILELRVNDNLFEKESRTTALPDDYETLKKEKKTADEKIAAAEEENGKLRIENSLLTASNKKLKSQVQRLVTKLDQTETTAADTKGAQAKGEDSENNQPVDPNEAKNGVDLSINALKSFIK